MCGLLGVVRTTQSLLATDIEKFLRLLYIVDQTRGEHSTGLLAVPEKFEPKKDCAVVYKKAMNAMDFLNMPQTKQLLTNIKDFTFFAGHNRYATKGMVSNNNAHPFQINNITLMHNGTIHQFGAFSKDANSIPVDSMALAYFLTGHNLVDVLKELTGSYALMYHDAHDNSFNVIRNTERPLLMAETAFGYAFSSEEWMLDAASNYSGVKLSKVKQVNPYTHYKFVTSRKSANAISDVELQIIDYSDKLKKASTTTHYGGRQHSSYDDSYMFPRRGHVNLPATTTQPAKKEELLAKAGLKMDEEIEICIEEFHPAAVNGPNKYWGTAYGTLKADPNVNVIYSMCPAEFFEFLEEGVDDYTIKGTIIDGFMRTAHNGRGSRAFVQEFYVSVNKVYALADIEECPFKVTPKSKNGATKGELMEITKLESSPILDAEPTLDITTSAGLKATVMASAWAQAQVEGCALCGGNLSVATTIIDEENNFLCSNCAQELLKTGNVINFPGATH